MIKQLASFRQIMFSKFYLTYCYVRAILELKAQNKFVLKEISYSVNKWAVLSLDSLGMIMQLDRRYTTFKRVFLFRFFRTWKKPHGTWIDGSKHKEQQSFGLSPAWAHCWGFLGVYPWLCLPPWYILFIQAKQIICYHSFTIAQFYSKTH